MIALEAKKIRFFNKKLFDNFETINFSMHIYQDFFFMFR